MTHLERQLRDGIRRLLEAEPDPQARADQFHALRALLTLPNVAALLDIIDDLRGTLEGQEPPTVLAHRKASLGETEALAKPWTSSPAPVFADHCSNALEAMGKPHPRTCQLCGLGPCKAVLP